MTELKPCPFCGGEVSLKDMGYFWMISRSNKSSCKCRVFLESRAFTRDNLGAMERAKERLIEKWNRRLDGWHTGTPTEEGLYLVLLDGHYHKDTSAYIVALWGNSGWRMTIQGTYYNLEEKVIAWQKIEPFKEESNGKE